MATIAEKVLTYLLVDDNLEHAQDVERCLQELDGSPRVTTVRSGADCLAYVAGEGRFSDRQAFPFPDAVLLDLRMSGEIDGLQTLQAIREDAASRRLQVFILAQGENDADVRCASDLGASGCIVKTTNTRELAQRLAGLHASLLAEAEKPTPTEEPAAKPKSSEPPRERERTPTPINETETLDQLMQFELPVAYKLLTEIYRRDRWEALQLLISLSQVVPGRFSKLAVQFCEKDGALAAGGDDVDWNFLEQIVMNRLPSCTGRDQFAKIVAGISSVLSENETVDRNSAMWHTWHGFHRAATLSRATPRDPNRPPRAPRAPREEIVIQPLQTNHWKTAALVSIGLLVLTVAGYLVDKFVLLGL